MRDYRIKIQKELRSFQFDSVEEPVLRARDLSEQNTEAAA